LNIAEKCLILSTWNPRWPPLQDTILKLDTIHKIWKKITWKLQT